MFEVLSGQNSPEAGSQTVIPPFLTCSTGPAPAKTATPVDAVTQVATVEAVIQTVQKVTEPLEERDSIIADIPTVLET